VTVGGQSVGCYVLSDQSDRQLHECACDVYVDTGDSGGTDQAVRMISDSQVYVLNAGESVVLECYFTAAKYNMFDYPLLWKKVSSPSLSLRTPLI